MPKAQNYPRLSLKKERYIKYLFTDAQFVELRAAQLAGYTNAPAAIARLRNDDLVRAEIKARFDAEIMTRDETMKRLSDIARGAMKIFIRDGQIDLDSELAKENYHLIKKIRVQETIRPQKDNKPIVTITTDIETYDALTALTLIARHHALFSDTDRVAEQNNIQFNLTQLNALGIDKNIVAGELQKMIAALGQENIIDVENIVDTENT